MVCGGPRGVWLSCGGGCGRGLRARGFRILPYVRLSSVRQIMQPLGCDPRTVAHFADIAPRPLLWSLSACTLQWLMRTMGEMLGSAKSWDQRRNRLKQLAIASALGCGISGFRWEAMYFLYQQCPVKHDSLRFCMFQDFALREGRVRVWLWVTSS